MIEKIDKIEEKIEEYENALFVVDIETTGLDPFRDMICEIGICLLNLADGQTFPVVNTICQEKCKNFSESAWIFSNSDLKYEDVAKATYFIDIKDDLQEILHLEKATAYNQLFDFRFLEDRGIQIKNTFIDVMYVLRDIIEIPHHYYGVKLPSVQESWNFLFGRDGYRESHRALDDAMHEAQIIYESYKRGYI
jgi:DNA polymerase-3 subunit epsilon